MSDAVTQLDIVIGQGGQAGDVAGEVGAARAEVIGAVVHELVGGQLRPAVEQVQQGLSTERAGELVVVTEPHHRQAAAPRGDLVQGAGGLLLVGEQRVACLLPFPGGNDWWLAHRPDYAP